MAPHPTEATIVFVAFAGEEQGLYGSDHFAELAKTGRLEHPGRAEHGHHRQPDRRQRRPRPAHDPAVLRGRADERDAAARPRARQSIGGENDGISRQLARYVKETGENSATGMSVKLVWRRDRFLRGGDQISFLQRGWPAVRFTEPNENYDHQHQDVRVENGKQFGDLLEFVDFRYLARVTRVVGSSLAALARAPRAPVNARVIITRSSPTTPSCAGTQPRARRRRLRGRLARLHRAAVDARAPRRQRHGVHDRRPQQGRLPGRRAGDRP